MLHLGFIPAAGTPGAEAAIMFLAQGLGFRFPCPNSCCWKARHRPLLPQRPAHLREREGAGLSEQEGTAPSSRLAASAVEGLSAGGSCPASRSLQEAAVVRAVTGPRRSELRPFVF